MSKSRVYFIWVGLMTFFAGNAHATTSSQVLVMSKQLYQIGQDLTTGLWPTAILMIALGLWAAVHAFGKNMGDGIHQVTNIIAVGGMLIFGTSMLTNLGFFSCTF